MVTYRLKDGQYIVLEHDEVIDIAALGIAGSDRVKREIQEIIEEKM